MEHGHATPPMTQLALSVPLDLDRGLARFGFPSFRPGQRESIETLLAEGRLLLVAPTGGGKSLIYQLPASLLPGTTLVVSPLISLMVDQVNALEGHGIPSTFLAGTLSHEEMKRRLSNMARGAYKLVYAAPERLVFPGFRSLLRDIECPLIAIDEAHCISEWGHDFRPEYLQIGSLLSAMPDSRVLACTATATPVVRDEILERLGLEPTTPQIVRGFARPNLALSVHEVGAKKERSAHVDAVLEAALGEPSGADGAAIVYAPTRKVTEEEADRLAVAGWRARAYHAGLGGPTRDRVQKTFLNGETDVIVATNAFGMGIDRADVRAVVHLAPPGSLEAYYQEVGRAGRDGKDSTGTLLVSPGDMPLRRHLIESDVDGFEPDPAVVRHKWGMFLELMRWAEGGSCRHDAILRYFGDEEETLAGCGHCDVCRRMTESGAGDAEEVSTTVRKALSAVARLRGRFGLQVAAKLLKGTEDPRLARAGLHATRTFGTLADRSEEWLARLLRRCVTAGWVDFEGGDRPVVVLTESGRAAVHGERPIRMLLPPERRSRPAPVRAVLRRGGSGEVGAVVSAGDGESTAAVPHDALDDTGLRLFEALRHHRLTLARARKVPPYVIASDRTLREIAMLRPRTLAELELAHGIGPAKVKKYGKGLLKVCAEVA